MDQKPLNIAISGVLTPKHPIQTASREGHRVEITTEFPQPVPMEWAR